MTQTEHRTQALIQLMGKVRARDPETSWWAAEQQHRFKTEKLKGEIWVILSEVGPMNDDELYRFRQLMVKRHAWSEASPQSVRSRRSELVTDGRVRPLLGPVPDARPDGTRPPTPTVKRGSNMGGPSIVWEAVPR